MLHTNERCRRRRRLGRGQDGRRRRDDPGSQSGVAQHRAARDTGEGYETFLRQLAEAWRILTPTRAYLACLDRKRPKNGSDYDWTHPQDPDAKITKMRDGRTRLAHKAERAEDLETGAVVGVSVQDMSTVIQISPTCGVRPLKWTVSGGRIDRRWGYQEVNPWPGIAATARSSSAKWRSGVTVPHPVSWTHVYATRHGVARIARALRAACDTPASRGASTGCSVRRTQRRPRAPRRDFERPGRRRLAP